jgi:hypothetical protein
MANAKQPSHIPIDLKVVRPASNIPGNPHMKISELPKNHTKTEIPLYDLVFSDFDDTDQNPRPGLGYHQLYDPQARIALIAKLPDVPRTGDTVTLLWDDVDVQRYDIDDTLTAKGWLSFAVPTDRATGPEHSVQYTLRDNFTEEVRRSNKRLVAVDRQPPGGLDDNTATPINERLAPCTVSPSSIIDVNKPVTVTVPRWINAAVGDELTVMWNNIRYDHPKLDQTLYDELIAQGEVHALIPKDVLEQGGSSPRLMVNYEIRDRVDNYSLVSPATFISVEIDPAALTGPLVREANRTTHVLDLEALGSGDGHVETPFYLGNENPYTVKLTWIGKTATADIELKLGDIIVNDPYVEHATFVIPNDRLKEIAGGSAVVRYSLEQQGDTDATGAQITKVSKTTTITLTGLQLPLPAAMVQGAVGSIIDINQLIGAYVNVEIPAYAGKKTGDKISLTWSGVASDGTAVNYVDDYVVEEVQEETEPHIFEVDELNIKPLPGGTLKITYQVLRATATSPENSEISQYSVVGATLTVEDFTGQQPNLIKAGGFIQTDKMRINFISGEGSVGFPVLDTAPPEAPDFRVPFLHVCFPDPSRPPATQTIDIVLTQASKVLECDIYACNGSIDISLLDDLDNVIHTFKPPAQTTYRFNHETVGRLIKTLRIVAVNDWTYWDNFSMST